MGYVGMCSPQGYGFSAVLVINRVGKGFWKVGRTPHHFLLRVSLPGNTCLHVFDHVLAVYLLFTFFDLSDDLDLFKTSVLIYSS